MPPKHILAQRAHSYPLPLLFSPKLFRSLKKKHKKSSITNPRFIDRCFHPTGQALDRLSRFSVITGSWMVEIANGLLTTIGMSSQVLNAKPGNVPQDQWISLVTYRSSPKGKAVDVPPPSRAHVFLETRKNRKTEPTRMDEKSKQAVLHSVFLDVRKLRRMAGIRNAESGTVKVEWVLNWFTFIFARLKPYALILIKVVRDASKFDKGMENFLICQPVSL